MPVESHQRVVPRGSQAADDAGPRQANDQQQDHGQAGKDLAREDAAR